MFKRTISLTAVITLLFLFGAILSPLNIHYDHSSDSESPRLVKLNVCHSSGLLLSANCELPVAIETQRDEVPLELYTFFDVTNQTIKPFYFISSIFKPPQV